MDISHRVTDDMYVLAVINTYNIMYLFFQGINPLPLEQIGHVLSAPDEEAFCDDWPAPDFQHQCDIMCADSGLQFITDNKLDDIRDLVRLF